MLLRTVRTIALFVAITSVALLGLGEGPEIARGGTNGRVFTVNTLIDNDDGNDPTCSLREAIRASNMGGNYNGCTGQNNPGTDDDRIQFALGNGNPVIDVLSNLYSVTTPVVIDGATGGATRVVLHGPGATNASGLEIDDGADNSEVRNLVINNFLGGYPISVDADGVRLVGNYIGTNAAGTSAVPNQYGLDVDGDNTRIGGAIGTTPGGPCTGDCNLMSGNTEFGMRLGGLTATVEGNFIGTNVTGSQAIPNGGFGIFVRGDGALIGGAGDGAGNVVSGNLNDGIAVGGLMTSIRGNLIGTNSAGTDAVPNRAGVIFDSGDSQSQSVLGGSSPEDGNVISGNLAYGIGIASPGVAIAGNLIGTDLTGENPLPNGEEGVLVIFIQGSVVGGPSAEYGNVIAFNGAEGVRVSEEAIFVQIRRNSVFANDLKGIEIDAGSNGDIIAPTILSTDSSGASGTAAAPYCVGVGSACLIDIYSDSEDEGHTYEGSTLTDVAGNWTFDGPLTGPNITATATDDGGDTSEFSVPFVLNPPTPSPSPTLAPTASTPPSPTSAPSTTPTATAAGVEIAWGDLNCSGAVDTEDALLALVHAAEMETDTGVCPEMGDEVDVQNASTHVWGDVDCSDEIEAFDALELFRFATGLETDHSGSCPDVGDAQLIAPFRASYLVNGVLAPPEGLEPSARCLEGISRSASCSQLGAQVSQSQAKRGSANRPPGNPPTTCVTHEPEHRQRPRTARRWRTQGRSPSGSS